MKTLWISDAGRICRWHGQWAGTTVLSSTRLPGLTQCEPQRPPGKIQADAFTDGLAIGKLTCGSSSTPLLAARRKRCTLLQVPAYDLTAKLDHQAGLAIWTGNPDCAAAIPFLCGPVALLLLAWQGQFTWHASAIARDGGPAVLLCGVSGAGKSTLARQAAKRGWIRLCDDLTSIDSNAAPSIPGPLPQLKLVPPMVDTLPTPIDAIVVLDPQPGAARLQSLPTNRAVTELVRHTVAARLFGRELLARHLTTAGKLASAVNVVRLTYHQIPSQIGPCLEQVASLTGVAT